VKSAEVSRFKTNGPKNNPTKQSRRLLALDILRGFFLFAIIINHTPLSPQLTILATGAGQMAASAAEGFFLVSGLLVGYLYTPKIITNTKLIVKKILKRAGLLYAISITTTLLFTFAALVSKVDPTGTLYTGSLLDPSFLTRLFTLEYVYGWADFLSRYAVFMAITPAVLLLIAYGYTRLVFVCSLIVWILSPLLGSPEFTAWQLLFFGGAIAGSRFDQTRQWFASRSGIRYLYLVCSLAILTLAYSHYVTILYPNFVLPALNTLSLELPQAISNYLAGLYEMLRPALDKEYLGFVRVIAAFLWFVLLLSVFMKYEKKIDHYTFGILRFIGQNSLLVYVIHSIIIFIVASLVTLLQPNVGVVVNTIVGLLVFAAVIISTKLIIRLRRLQD
jgi:hypothetical protein